MVDEHGGLELSVFLPCDFFSHLLFHIFRAKKWEKCQIIKLYLDAKRKEILEISAVTEMC